MLIRQTILYLPAQLLPAVAQFASLAIWSHFASAEVIGIVTLLVSIQEFLVLGLMGFWTIYTVRFATKPPADEQEAERVRRTSSTVVFGSAILQALVAVVLYPWLIAPFGRAILIPIIMLMVGGRAFNVYQGERGRARGDIRLYSVMVVTGPVVGLIAGAAMLRAFGSNELWAFLGYAIAQTAAAIFGLLRDRSWVAFGRLDFALLRHALRYGMPLIVGAALIWVTQNISRLAISHELGLAAAGIFSLGFGLGFRAAAVSAMAVTAAAFPLAARLYNAGDEAGAMRQLAANAVLLAAALCGSMAGLALVAPDMLNLFINSTMRQPVYPVMMWSILAGTAACFRQHFVHQIFLLKGNTRPLAVVAGVEAVGAVACTLAVVPFYGAVGATAALAIVSIVTMVAMLAMGVREGFRMPWVEFGKVALATAMMAAVVVVIPPAHNIAMLLGRVSAGAVTFALALGLMYRREIQALAGPFLARKTLV